MYPTVGLRGPEIQPEWRSVLLRDPCVYCGEPSTGLDHIQPRADGGRDAWWNRAPACAACDHAKGHTPLLIFLTRAPATSCYRPNRRLRDEHPPPRPLTYTIAELMTA